MKIETNGNFYIEELLTKIESLSIFSERFNQRIELMCLHILQRGRDKNEFEIISQEIAQLKNLMKAVKIFDHLFITSVSHLLENGLLFEFKK